MNSFELAGKYCVQNKVIVLEETECNVHIGMCADDSSLRERIERVFNRKKYFEKKIQFSVIEEDVWKRKIAKKFSQHLLSFSADLQKKNEKNEADEEPIINLLNSMIIECHFHCGSDIHIEYSADKITVRFRIHGYIYDQMDISYETGEAVIQRIKLLSKLEITEHRKCQDGRFNFSHLNHNLDIRVSCIPSFYGESVVMRLLDRKSALLSLYDLGFSSMQLLLLDKIQKEKNGLVLICGSTGSGKTTTLCSMLNEMTKVNRKILSIEDPVEYVVPGVVQIAVNDERGLTFSEVLKRIYRQDPDVIVIGEVRDELTAQTAVRSAMTGHLVFATLHTGTASEAVCRLLDFGIQGFLLAPVLRSIIVQDLEHLSLKERKLHARIITCGEKIRKTIACAENYEKLHAVLDKDGEVCA